ncbi:MAG: snapalysin [Streptomyces sp.]|uniref:snapalysin n=1 Tax=Streptomyces sp. TaxID=1931 RepID=UPI003D6A3DD8
MKYRKTALSATLGLGFALGLGAMPASAATPDDGGSAKAGSSVTTGYTGESNKANEAFFNAVVKDALKKQAAKPGIQLVTVNYDASGAPSFASEIANSTAVWNSSVSNVQLAEGGGASFDYREGNDPRGSYASTDGHGRGYIFLDYAQSQQYDSDRITSHETGHVLGLPDHYEGPCSELMSGGGPGPSCTNDRPDANESARVNQLWANGVANVAFDQAAFAK